MRRSTGLLLTATLTGALAAACAPPGPDPVLWFVHATDPHLFEEMDGQAEAARQRQERLNREAFQDLLTALRLLPGRDGKPAFMVLTGDLGIATSAGEPPARDRSEQVRELAELLAASPVEKIYLVPGESDVAGERAAGLPEAGVFFERLAEALAGKPVTVRDLTRCYHSAEGPLEGCFVDVAQTYRLVGFPSHSFRNRRREEPTAAQQQPGEAEPAGRQEDRYAENESDQQWQLGRLEALLDDARAKGRRALVLSHVPNLDDPARLARSRFSPPDGAAWETELGYGNPRRPEAGFWNVSETVFQDWKRLIDADGVAAVLSGHLHDAHRELYRPPYAWSTPSAQRPAPGKLLLAPPLAVSDQVDSPFQARGFALVGLAADGVRQRLYWYDPTARSFRAEPGPAERPARPRGGALGALAAWLEALFTGLAPLARVAVVSIALLAAFLTAAHLWKIPAPAGRLSSAPSADDAAAESKEGLADPFKSNFGRTVVSVLSGLAVVAFLDAFWGEAGGGNQSKALYVVFFVAFFFLFLVLFAVTRGAVEALRSRIAVEQSNPQRREAPEQSAARAAPAGPAPPARAPGDPSKRAARLVFWDTALGFMVGKNQSRTVALGEEILDLQIAMIDTADQVREELHAAILRALREAAQRHAAAAGGKPREVEDTDIRVNVSALSADGSRVLYVSLDPGSMASEFSSASIAWVCVAGGVARWFKTSYLKLQPRVELLAATSGRLPHLKKPLYLDHYFEDRGEEDYQGFMVLPIPWRRRGLEDVKYHPAGIHLSFRTDDLMDWLWQGLEGKTPGDPSSSYRQWSSLIDNQPTPDSAWTADPFLRASLRQALRVLGPALSRFNETLFRSQILPRKRTW